MTVEEKTIGINSVCISGRISKVYDYGGEYIISSINCNDEIFYIYWNKGTFNLAEVLYLNHVCITGILSNVSIKVPRRKTNLATTAIYVKRMEKVKI